MTHNSVGDNYPHPESSLLPLMASLPSSFPPPLQTYVHVTGLLVIVGASTSQGQSYWRVLANDATGVSRIGEGESS